MIPVSRSVYTALFYVLTPLVVLRLFWRSWKAPDYRQRVLERFAVYSGAFASDVIWVHAVSVGEVEAVVPLVNQLQSRYPQQRLLLTTTTPTGSARVKAIWGDAVVHVYFPYDLPLVIGRFLRIFRPRMLLVMEKEIWPNLYHACRANEVPIVILNARLSAQSARAYLKIPGLIQPALACVKRIACQTEEDKLRFVQIGATETQMAVTGNLKFDVLINPELKQVAKSLRAQFFPGRFVFIVGSTHDNEESLFFDIYADLKQQISELLLIVVPRHPERFAKVFAEAEKRGLSVCTRSSQVVCEEQTDVLLVDRMGELKLFFGAADLSFVGGSLIPVGGHNILEPMIMQTPVIFGPYMFNFKQIVQDVLAADCGIQCPTMESVLQTVVSLYQQPARRLELTEAATAFLQRNQGATERTLTVVDSVWPVEI